MRHSTIKRPTAFFGSQLTESQIRARFQPIVTSKEGYDPTVRTKVRSDGGNATSSYPQSRGML